MKEMIRTNVEEMIRKARRKRLFKRVVAMLCVITLLNTALMLRLEADTIERIPDCGFSLHVHEAACFDDEGNLICGLPEHVHTDACYQTRPVKRPASEDMLEAMPEEVAYELAELETFDGLEAPVEEAGIIELGDDNEVTIGDTGAQSAAVDYVAPTFDLDGYSTFRLSAILSAAYPGIGVADVTGITETVSSEDQPLSIAAVAVDGGRDYDIVCTRDFIDDDTVELAINTDRGFCPVTLKNGIKAELTEETPEAEMPTEEETTETKETTGKEETTTEEEETTTEEEETTTKEEETITKEEETITEEEEETVTEEEETTTKEEEKTTTEEEETITEKEETITEEEEITTKEEEKTTTEEEETTTEEEEKTTTEEEETTTKEEETTTEEEETVTEEEETAGEEEKPAGEVENTETEETAEGEETSGEEAAADAVQPQAERYFTYAANIDVAALGVPFSLSALMAEAVLWDAPEAAPEEEYTVELSDDLLSEPLEALEIALEEEPASLSRLDYDGALFAAEEAEGDWLFTPLKSFEAATIVFVDGDTYILNLYNYKKPVAFPAQSFEAHVAGMAVYVDAEAGAFPEGTEMFVTPVYDAATLDEIAGTVQDDSTVVKKVHAVDITFRDADGREIEPLLPIAVRMDVEEVKQSQETVVVHMDSDGNTEIMEQTITESLGEEASETMVAFDAAAFSVYAVVVTERYIAFDGTAWNIQVTYGSDAGIPDGAALDVREITNDEYESCLEMTEAALADRSVLSARFFDISILYGGEKLQPSVPVEVRISMAQEEGAVRVVHFGENVEVIEGVSQDGGAVVFDAQSFSVYGVAHTVQFGEGTTWNMPGGSTTWLKILLEKLGFPAEKIAKVAGVEFSSDNLTAEPKQTDEGLDWLITCVESFFNENDPGNPTETIYMEVTLSDSDVVQRISVVDIGYDYIDRFLTRVEFTDDGVHVGGSDDPAPMQVRVGHEYALKLVFSEDEHKEGMQFPDSGIMKFVLPKYVCLPAPVNGADYVENTFDIVLDKKNTLKDNIARYYPPVGDEPGYMEIEWNTTDRKGYKLLTASPRATFSINYTGTTLVIQDTQSVVFTSGVTVEVEEDPDYNVGLVKLAEPKVVDGKQTNIIDYTVMVYGTGNTKDVTIADEMGEALTFLPETFRVEYQNRHDIPDSAAGECTVPPVSYSDRGFSTTLTRLNDGCTAIFKYSAAVDYRKLGGKDNIATTAQNRVSAFDVDGRPLTETTHEFEDEIKYLDLAKYYDDNGIVYIPTSDENGEHSNWDVLYIPYTVTYNPDLNVNVEGATLDDQFYAGAKRAVSYVTDAETNLPPGVSNTFVVKAYAQKGSIYQDNGKFTPANGEEGIVIKQNWDDVTVTTYYDPNAQSGEPDTPPESAGIGEGDVTIDEEENEETLTTWKWTIPEFGEIENDPRNPNVTYAYTITYWTKVEREKAFAGGYVRNEVHEDYADQTRDRTKRLPGDGTDSFITVHKEHIEDVYVRGGEGEQGHSYSRWEITFKRRDNALEAAVVEDTLPHIDNNKGGVYADQFVKNSSSVYKWNNNDSALGDYGWRIEGLVSGEVCVANVSTQNDTNVVFRFYKTYYGANDKRNRQGLKSIGQAGSETIKIIFWTDNSIEWIKASERGELTPEHLNHVHLVLDGHEANDHDFGVPERDPDITKTMVKAGTWTNENGITMPLYRYTLTLTGLNDSVFKNEYGELTQPIVIHDTYELPLTYIPVNRVTALEGSQIVLENDSHSDERLLRTVPAPAPGHTAWHEDVTIEQTDDQSDTTDTITITIPYSEGMKCPLTDENGNPVTNHQGLPVSVYGQAYEVSYYMVLDHDQVLQKAQDMVNEDKRSDTFTTETSKKFGNRAEWTISTGEVASDQPTAKAEFDLKPVNKSVSYNEATELATYKIVVNPLKLTINGGQRYKLEDEYHDMAVDFQTVSIKCEPPLSSGEHAIEWTYHGSVGTFWLPDERKVTIEYTGWPIGERGAKVNFTNTAKVLGYTDVESTKTTLKADHEGSASTFRIRLFKFGDDNMDNPLGNAVFQLFENVNGVKTPMTYKAEWHHPKDDEPEWDVINDKREDDGEARLPTPEDHNVGDYIYFVTSNGIPESASEGTLGSSIDKGYAEVMLSQSRDGVSLKKNHQYYLREIMEPEGYIKEDIDWHFIIGDNDDWEHYIYTDDSVMQISNASKERAFTLHKIVENRSSSDKPGDFMGFQRNMQFEIAGSDDTGRVFYNKTVLRGDFKPVDNVQPDGTTKREYMLIIRNLAPGHYTVTELGKTAYAEGTELTTLVTGTLTQTPTDGNQTTPPVVLLTADPPTSPDAAIPASSARDTSFSFTITGDYDTVVDATFTNIYTDAEAPTVDLTVTKQWSGNVTGRQAVFTLYADGEPYKLTQAEGADADGNLVLPQSDDWSVTLNKLPKYKKGTEEEIVWTIEEVGAGYRLANDAQDTNVSGLYLDEHFTVTSNNGGTNHGHFPFTSENAITVSNALNSLVTVTAQKIWQDGENHAGDVVYIDLYRTKADIPASPDCAALAEAAGSELLIENYALNAENNWIYENKLLEGVSGEGERYHYFAVERSVAGYDAAYAIGGTTAQTIDITNTPHESSKRGQMTIAKVVTGPEHPNKTFRFTLWNSGKYLHEDIPGSPDQTNLLTTDYHEIAVSANSTVTFSKVPLGDYILTELTDDIGIGGYDLVSVSINGVDQPLEAPSAVISVSEGAAVNVNVTNAYQKQTVIPKTSFKFGKLWVIPDTDETTALPWPDDTRITLDIQRRLRGDEVPDSSFHKTFTVSKVIDASEQWGEDGMRIREQQYHLIADSSELAILSSDYYAAKYNHYTFELGGIDKYDANGNEWEYFAVERAQTGDEVKKFTIEYGHVNGIAAEVVAGQADASSYRPTDGELVDYMECAINRLDITQDIAIPVRKFVNGRQDIDGKYPPFIFNLYTEDGKPVEGGTAISTSDGTASFDLTSLNLINLNEMKWRSYDKKLTGKYTFWIREQENDPKTSEYNGITYLKGAAKVVLNVVYDWQTGTLSPTMSITNPGDKTASPDATEVTITNTYDPGEVRLTIRKHWDDDNDRDGYRKPVDFQITASYQDDTGTHALSEVWFLAPEADGRMVPGQSISIPLTQTLGTRTDVSTTVRLPKYYEGHEIAYTVAEVTNANLTGLYTLQPPVSSAYAYSATNKHTPETISVQVEKQWKGKVPTSDDTVTMRLKATYSGTTVTYDSIDSNSPWYPYVDQFEDQLIQTSATWADLPRYAPGKVGVKVKYTVEEVPEHIPLGYHVIEDSASRADDTTLIPASATAENVIVNQYEYVRIPVKKIWRDDYNRDGQRPTSVTMRLTAHAGDESIRVSSQLRHTNNVPVSAEITFTGQRAEEEWVNEGWEYLPKYYHGQQITYTVWEVPLSEGLGYTTSNNGEVKAASNDDNVIRTVTNTRDIERKDIALTKTWTDNLNQDGKRPALVYYVNTFVRLTAQLTPEGAPTRLVLGGEKPGEAGCYYLCKEGENTPLEFNSVKPYVELEGSDAHDAATATYVITWHDLPVYRDEGTLIEYTAKETDDEGRELTVNGINKRLSTSPSAAYKDYIITSDVIATSDGFAVTNDYRPEEITLRVNKTWEHGNREPFTEADKQQLYDGARMVLVATVNGKEAPISEWAKQPNYPYVIVTEQPLTSDALADHHYVVWEHLPKYAPGGVKQPITYSVVESHVPEGYHMFSDPETIDSTTISTSAAFDVTNLYEVVQVEARKVWDDANNQDGLRLSDMTVQFRLEESQDGENWIPVSGRERLTLGSSPNAAIPVSGSWAGLPAWRNNQRVYYRAAEVESTIPVSYHVVQGVFEETQLDSDGQYEHGEKKRHYKAVGENTNVHVPDTRTVTFTKHWDNMGVADNPVTPEAYADSVRLYARAKGSNAAPTSAEIGEPPVSANWRDHITVIPESSGDYTVMVTDLPVHRPRAELSFDPPVSLEYFLTEDAIENYVVNYGDGRTNIPESGTLTNIRDTGDLSITKRVVSDREADKDIEFTFTVRTSTPLNPNYGYNAVTSSANAVPTSEWVYFTADGSGGYQTTLTLKKDQSVRIEKLPAGLDFTVTETPVTNFTTQCNPTAANVMADSATSARQIVKNEVQSTNFTNTRALGELTVRKSVISAINEDSQPGQRYRFQIDLHGLTSDARNKTYGDVRFTNGSATIELSEGGAIAIGGIPSDIQYTVTEIAASPDSLDKFTAQAQKTGVDDYTAQGYTFPDGNTPPESADWIVVNGSNVNNEVSFTNTRKTGTLTIKKAFADGEKHWIPGDDDIKFAVDVVLTPPTSRTLNLGADTTVKVKTGAGDAIPLSHTGNTLHVFVSKREPVIIEGIPVDTAYRVSEVPATDSFNRDAKPVTGTFTAAGSKSVEMTFDKNDRRTGNLQVSKTVVSPVLSEQTQPYTINLLFDPVPKTSEYTGVNSWDNSTQTVILDSEGRATVSVRGGGHVTIQEIPTSVTVTVSEDAPLNFTNAIDNPTNMIAASETVYSAVTNTRETGSLQVSKAVHSAVQGDKTHDFKFRITFGKAIDQSKDYGVPLTFNAEGTEATFTLSHGQSANFTGLPVSVGYHVEELREAAQLPDYPFTTDNFTTVPVSSDGTISAIPASADFTNTRNTGALTITKALANAIPDDENTTFYFDVELTGEDGRPLALDPNAPITVNRTTDIDYSETLGVIRNVPVVWTSGGGSTTIEGLPVNTTYRVTEARFDTQTTPENIIKDSSTLSGTIRDSAEAGFTNTRKTGNLEISKTVESPVISEKEAQTYPIKVKLETTVGKRPVSGTFTSYINDSATGTPVMFDSNGEATIQVSHGQTVRIADIPTDVRYTVTEAAPDNFTNTLTGETGEIPASDTAVSTVTNTRDTGTLTVSKTLVSAAAADVGREFDFTVTLDRTTPIYSGLYGVMDFKDNVATIRLSGGQSATAEGLPTGIGYTVAEIPASDFNTTFVYDTGEILASETAAFTNSRKTGTLTIEKAFKDDGKHSIPGDDDIAFTFEIALSRADGALRFGQTGAEIKVGERIIDSATFTVTASKNNPATVTGIPVGTAYTVTEIPVSANFNHDTIPQSGEIAVSSSAVTQTFTNDRKTGVIAITKTVVSPVTKEKTEDTYTVDLTLRTVGGIPVSGEYVVERTTSASSGTLTFTDGAASIELHHGETLTIKDIPTDVVCHVAEREYSNFITEIPTSDVPVVANDTATSTITNTRRLGELAVSKAVDSDVTKDTVDREFLFKVELKDNEIENGTYGGMTFENNVAEVWLKHGDTATAVDLPMGYAFDVTELDTGEAAYTNNFSTTWARTDIPVSGEGVAFTGGSIPESSAAALTFTNDRKTGSLTINKELTANAIPGDEDVPFTFEVTLNHPDGLNLGDTTRIMAGNAPVESATFRVTASQSSAATITGIPVGTVYTVREVEPAVDNFIRDAIPQSGEIAVSASAASKTFTNDRRVNDLVITKTATSPIIKEETDYYIMRVELSASDSLGTRRYEVSPMIPALENGAITQIMTSEVTFAPDGGTASVALIPVSAGTSVTIKGIPTDVTYAVSEPGYDDDFNVALTGGRGTIERTDKSQTTVTNERKVGGLSITKRLANAIPGDSDHEFWFKVVAGGDPIKVSDYGALRFENNTAIVNLKAGETATAEGLPANISYTVTEISTSDQFGTVPDGFDPVYMQKFVTTWTGDGTATEGSRAATATIAELATSAVSCTNTRRTGDLALRKVVNSPFARETTQDAYQFNVRLTKNGIPVSGTYDTSSGGTVTFDAQGECTIPVSGSQTVTILEIPMDVQYEVAEIAVSSHFAVAYSYGQNVGANAVHTIAPEVPSSVTITNTRTALPIQVYKVTSENLITPLGGVKFTLTQTEPPTSPEGWTVKLKSNAEGLLESDQDEALPFPLTDGIMTLPVGTYSLQETEAPAGFVLLTSAVPITVTEKGAEYHVFFGGDEINLTKGNKGGTIDETGTLKIVLRVPNGPAARLPATGGPGTALYTASGIALILLAALLLLRRRRED